MLLLANSCRVKEIDNITGSVAPEVECLDVVVDDLGLRAYLSRTALALPLLAEDENWRLTETLSIWAKRLGMINSPKPPLYCIQEHHISSCSKVLASLLFSFLFLSNMIGTDMAWSPTKMLRCTTL